jgi:hypothetical protein
MAWRMKGQWIKNCNCFAPCTCDGDGRASPHNFCEGVVGMRITEGNFDSVDLTGLKWAAAVHWPGHMFEGNGTIEAVIDSSASAAQREALMNILSGKHGGTLFEIIAAVCPNFAGVQYLPIDFQFDYDKRTANVNIPGWLETTSGPIMWPPENHDNRVQIRMPNGFEYKEAEVCHAKTLKSMGVSKFEYTNTNSSLALVEHTDKGLVA